MHTSLQAQKTIHKKSQGPQLKVSLPSQEWAKFSDGTPITQDSFNAWKRLKLEKRIAVNARHLKHSVKSWHDLLDHPIVPSEISRYYLVFMHIPKAGGTTLQHILSKNYLPNQFVHANNNQINKNPACLYHVKRREVRPIVMGHFDRSCVLYHLLCDRPIIHFTMFRDPLKRILSHYHYLQGNIGHGKHKEVRAMTLEEYASSSIKEIQNKQTLRLLGDSSRAAQQQSLNDPDPLFEQAKRILAQEFTLFGITEQYTQFLLMTKRMLQWDDILYRRQNKSKPHRSLDRATDLNQEEKKGIEMIQRRNQLDIRLYDFAQNLFRERYQQLGISASTEQRYEHVNQQYQHMVNELHGL